MQTELLSPAGNKDIAIAAINCGADAVYIGAPRFGARAAAGNSIVDIESVCKYARRYGVRIYATLNTLLCDDKELQEARSIAFSLYEAGCDAIIFQDISLLDIDLPPLPLHASTQCDNSSIEKILYLQERGVQRVVLPREFSLAQIRKVREATLQASNINQVSNISNDKVSLKAQRSRRTSEGARERTEVRDRATSEGQRRDLRNLETLIELETFIHGALCVCYSGRCYMSEYLTGRSANRGECSQPCRSYYNLIDGKGNVLIKDKHLLSLKDLSLSEHLLELANAGVMSFKIEGRLKDIDYVKNITAYYRKRIDSLGVEKTSAGKVSLNFIPQLNKTFSRGFTTYFFDSDDKTVNIESTSKNGRESKRTSFDLSSSIGEYVGTVVKTDGNKLHIKPTDKIEFHGNDGVYIQDKTGKIFGSNINNVTENILTLQTPFNAEKGTKVFRSFNHKFNSEILKENAAIRVIPTVILLDENFIFTIKDNYGNTATLEIKDEFEKALNAQNARENLEKQLRKSNEIFEVRQVNITLSPENIPFIPISKINEIRRQLFEKLENLRITKNRTQQAFATLPEQAQHNPYLPQKVNISEVPLMKTRYCILSELQKCPRTCSQSLKQPLFIENNGKKFLLRFNCNSTPCGMEILPA